MVHWPDRLLGIPEPRCTDAPESYWQRLRFYAKTLELVDILDDDVPPYAIISHTWGDEEISIQLLRRLGGHSHLASSSSKPLDKRRRAILSKKGYVKIAGAARLAVSRGLNYLWVDTVCIDKTSSSELSEAINSMYLWYEQSAECYAYLSDVEPPATQDANAFDENLRNSRWFTRGWTLQELVAPKLVLFYASDWSLLGQKHSPPEFAKTISEITSIDEEVLDGTIDPLHLSVSARMAWASHRNTTRPEDTAYCLMGLFQVNMPLLYGEGKRAFTRLQEHIIQRTDDQSIFAWNSFEDVEEDPDALFGLLAQSPAQFKDAGALQVLPPLPVYASAPSAMTNQGLRVQLYLLPRTATDETVMEEDYFTILDCVKRDRDVHLCPALHLRRLSEDQYGRLQPKTKHFKRPVSSSYQQEEGYRSVYIRQQPVYYHLPQFRLSPLNVESGLGSSDGVQYRLFDKYPARYWNSATMTLSVHYSPKLQAMGVFRFQSTDKSSEKVDVVVGLRRLNTMEWEGWCFQLAYRDEALENVFQEINKKIEQITHKSNQSAMTSATLRDCLGEDSTLASSASVEGVQLQGRLYISILVTARAELLTEGATFQISTNSIELSRCNSTLKSISSNSRARAMTEACCWSSSSQFELGPSSPFTWIVQPVRVASLAGDGAFMKPLYDFMSQIQQKKIEGGSNNTLSAIEQLAEALFIGDADKARTLIDTKSPDINSRTTDEYGFAPLHWAVAGGSFGCITLLRKNGAERKVFTESGLSPVHIAALCNNSVWEVLVNLNNETEASWLADERTWLFSETPLHLAAASTPDTELGEQFFKELLDWSCQYTGSGSRNMFEETPLHRAAAGNNANTIKALVACSLYGINIDNVDQYGRTSLWHAAAAGACNAIKSLIRLGASVNLTDDLGRSPLHAACRGGHDAAVKLLRQHSARSDTETNFLNLLPMHLAAMFGYVDCLTLFLDPLWRVASQASLDKAVQMAASFGKQACVEHLCQHGANPYVAFEYYLRPNDGHAIVVEKEADAYTAACLEQQWHIVSYFDTSEALRDLRDRIYSIEGQFDMDNIMPSFSAPIDALPPKGESEPAYILDPRQQHAPYHVSEPDDGSPAHENAAAPDTMLHASNNPHYRIAPNTDTPLYGSQLISASPYAPRQRPPQTHENLGRQQSVNLPDQANPYSSVPLSQSERLQELVNPQDGYRYQSALSQEQVDELMKQTMQAETACNLSILDFIDMCTSHVYFDGYGECQYLSGDLIGQVNLQNDLTYDEMEGSGQERQMAKQETKAMERAGKSRLFDALDNPAAVQQLIVEGEDVNYEDFLGATPLHWVFSQETPNLESAEIIHQNGGNMDSQDYQGNTPLEYAVRHAKTAAGTEWLLAKGADPNVKTKQNLLLFASSQGKTDILQMLLEAGADPNTPRHFPPLFSAMGLGKLFNETVDLLLAHGANPVAQTNGDMTPLAYAARHGNLSGRLGVIRKVYEQAQCRGTPYTAQQLSKALSEYRGTSYPRDFFEQFLEWNVDVNQKIARPNGGFTLPLIIACGDAGVDIDAVRHLLNLGADPTLADGDGNTPLHAAIHTGALDTVLFLLEILDAQAIDQANKHGQTALHYACGRPHLDPFNARWDKRFLLGPDLEGLFTDEAVRRFRDRTIISHRAETQIARRLRLIPALLSKGASPYAQDSLTGGTPLHYVCRLGVAEIVTALLEGCSGKCLQVTDNLGQTALHWAAVYGKAGAVKALQEWSQTEQDSGGSYGRNLPCVADKDGRLPLHLAARKGHDDAMDVLLEYTPATHYEAKDVDGRTPLWYAEEWFEDLNRWSCVLDRYDDCAGKIHRKLESVRGVDPRYYYAFAAVASLVGVAVIFRSAIAGAAGAVVALGCRLCVKAWRGGEVGWRWGAVAWRCAVAGWRSMRDEFHKSEGHKMKSQ
ncbi:hypothetical protein MKX08_002226 [Trichoderma sp. CBMAI-0020]|nr:hypothetical protein MKX08_002226 [Trichoderma sp. CBMAI-0020]